MTEPAATRDRPRCRWPADCCAPLLGEPLTSALARTLKALADPTRLRPVSMVAAHEGAAGPRQVTKVSGSWPRPP